MRPTAPEQHFRLRRWRLCPGPYSFFSSWQNHTRSGHATSPRRIGYHLTSSGKAGSTKLMAKKARAKKAHASGVNVISSKHVFTGPAFSVYSDVVREGEYTGRRDVVRHTGSVVVMAIK